MKKNHRTELDMKAEFNLEFARYLDEKGEHKGAKELRRKAMLQYKRRGKYKKEKSFPMCEYTSRIIHDNGIDGYVEKLIFNDKYDDYVEDAIDEFFEWWIERECLGSPYDCTGQSFTNWHKTARQGNHWVIYHSVGFDV